jgi:DNA gyrase/topoisomerase IV subunit B
MNIDLSKYKLVQPSHIRKVKNKKIMYDLSIKKNPTFHILLGEDRLLTHNCDGQHITALVINFFHKWFPYIIKEGRLKRLVTPLVAADHGNKGRKYFYSLKDFSDYKKKYKVSNIAYLKGLGSLSVEDWEYVMNNRVLFELENDDKTSESLEMAFGNSSQKRKTWLEGK